MLVLSLALVLALAITVVNATLATPRYRGPRSDHFDGERFHNLQPVEQPRAGVIRWMLTRQRGPWREEPGSMPGPPPPRRVGPGELRVTFVNHATVLVQMDGFNVLTDPIWSERCSPFSWAGPRRSRPPGVRWEDLPPIDAVLISHNHYDHLDVATLQRLAQDHRPRIYAALGNGPLLRSRGIPVTAELDWWQSVDLAPGLTLTGVPAQHFSNRTLTDRNRALWTGFVIQGRAGPVYFAGDTALGPHFEQIRNRFGAVRLALLPIGAYRPEWFMSPVHMSPSDAIKAHQLVGAATSVAIHFGTFQLGDDGIDEPVQRLQQEMQKLTPPPRFWVLGFGEGRDVPLATRAEGEAAAAGR
jgi:L-ascorbate metabolism protein UlaG (beta-lactamase superfamily)